MQNRFSVITFLKCVQPRQTLLSDFYGCVSKPTVRLLQFTLLSTAVTEANGEICVSLQNRWLLI